MSINLKSFFSFFKQIFDPRDEKLSEMERLIASYQEKLDSVTSNYQVNFLSHYLSLILLKRLTLAQP
jgi:hypothetical protein